MEADAAALASSAIECGRNPGDDQEEQGSRSHTVAAGIGLFVVLVKRIHFRSISKVTKSIKLIATT